MDMAMLSLCDHNIITYGTFGVWGALLSPNFDQKWVILPQASEYEVLWTIKDIKAANFDNFEFLWNVVKEVSYTLECTGKKYGPYWQI